jgi:hypothetical protein
MAHFERSSWTMRSSVDEKGPCCAILTASPEAPRSKSVYVHSIHRKDRRTGIRVARRESVVAKVHWCRRRRSRTRTSEPRELYPKLTPGKRTAWHLPSWVSGEHEVSGKRLPISAASLSPHLTCRQTPLLKLASSIDPIAHAPMVH